MRVVPVFISLVYEGLAVSEEEQQLRPPGERSLFHSLSVRLYTV